MKRIFSLLLLAPFALNAMEPESSNALVPLAPSPIRNIKLVSQIIVTMSETNEDHSFFVSQEPSVVFTHTAWYRRAGPENQFNPTNEELKDNNRQLHKTYQAPSTRTVAFSTEEYSAKARLIGVNPATQKALIHYLWKAKGVRYMARLVTNSHDNDGFDTSFSSTPTSFDSQDDSQDLAEPLEIGFGEASSLTISPVAPALKTRLIATDDAILKITAYNLDAQE